MCLSGLVAARMLQWHKCLEKPKSGKTMVYGRTKLFSGSKCRKAVLQRAFYSGNSAVPQLAHQFLPQLAGVITQQISNGSACCRD